MEEDAYAAGMKPDEFWNCTLPELFKYLTHAGKRNAELLRRIAYQIYISYDKGQDHQTLNLYQYWPMAGDPSEAEQEKERVRSEKAEEKRKDKWAKGLMKQYEQLRKKGTIA